MVSKTPFKVIHTSKTQFLEPNLVGFGRSIYVRRPWIKSGSKILEKKKVEIFEVDFCNAAGTRNTPLIILRLIFWWNVPYPTFFFQPCWSDYKGRDQAKKSGRLGVLEEVGGPSCRLSCRGKIVTIPKGPTAHQRLSNRPLPKGWDPRENRPISRISSHRIQIAQHRLGPCRIVKITIVATLLNLGVFSKS